MLQSHKAESFVGIVVGVFILSFVILGIINILIFSTNTTAKYNETNRIQVLKQNLTRAVKNTDTSMLKENEVFYVHKNRASSTFQIFTGSTNENFKYIDELGNSISEDISTLGEDLSSFEGDIYSQILWITTEDTSLIEENEVIRASIKRLIKK